MPDAISLQYPRPAREEPATERLLPLNPFRYTASDTNIKVFEPGHGRSTGDTVRFRNVVDSSGFQDHVLSSSGHTITKVDDDFYTFSTGGLSTLTDIVTGGEQASAGPVTVSN